MSFKKWRHVFFLQLTSCQKTVQPLAETLHFNTTGIHRPPLCIDEITDTLKMNVFNVLLCSMYRKLKTRQSQIADFARSRAGTRGVNGNKKYF